MMRLFLNGLAASAGGGITYLRNVLPRLSAQAGVHTTVAVHPDLRQEFCHLPNLTFVDVAMPPGAARRFWHEQRRLPAVIRASGAAVLISAGNFALWRSPVPQILLSRNSLYTSRAFYRDLRARREYAMWLDTRIRGALARLSIHWADRTVAPSKAFAEDLRRWTGIDVLAIHHGFDPEMFFQHSLPLPPGVRQKLDAAADAVRLLFVSHYNYYRNFETLISALPLLKRALSPRKVRLILTCELRSQANPGAYRAERAAALVRNLEVVEEVVELGALHYSCLSHVYRACDAYVTPAYTETFAHPLVEAMASGLPIVASDLQVHREICGQAAQYFQPFSAEELAARVAEVVGSAGERARLVSAASVRSRQFSWSRHVNELVRLAESLSSRHVTAELQSGSDLLSRRASHS
jgi:glycosyltransferase involved in cell wall biosynthesis